MLFYYDNQKFQTFWEELVKNILSILSKLEMHIMYVFHEIWQCCNIETRNAYYVCISRDLAMLQFLELKQAQACRSRWCWGVTNHKMHCNCVLIAGGNKFSVRLLWCLVKRYVTICRWLTLLVLQANNYFTSNDIKHLLYSQAIGW